MSMMLLESNNLFASVGTEGGIMVNIDSNELRLSEKTPASPRREGARRIAPADQLMYAWSISADHDGATVAEEIRVDRFRASEENCPPEVYLG